MSDVTRLLERASDGDPTAAADLLPLLYDQLRRVAAHKLAQEKPGQTLQATALVHEAWLRLRQSDRQAEKTVQRDWSFAKAWLSRALKSGP